jgi:hypothetical protein
MGADQQQVTPPLPAGFKLDEVPALPPGFKLDPVDSTKGKTEGKNGAGKLGGVRGLLMGEGYTGGRAEAAEQGKTFEYPPAVNYAAMGLGAVEAGAALPGLVKGAGKLIGRVASKVNPVDVIGAASPRGAHIAGILKSLTGKQAKSLAHELFEETHGALPKNATEKIQAVRELRQAMKGGNAVAEKYPATKQLAHELYEETYGAPPKGAQEKIKAVKELKKAMRSKGAKGAVEATEAPAKAPTAPAKPAKTTTGAKYIEHESTNNVLSSREHNPRK